jgi:hypothetical protein
MMTTKAKRKEHFYVDVACVLCKFFFFVFLFRRCFIIFHSFFFFYVARACWLVMALSEEMLLVKGE